MRAMVMASLGLPQGYNWLFWESGFCLVLFSCGGDNANSGRRRHIEMLMETYGIRVDLGNKLEALEVVEATATDDSDLDGLFVGW